MLLTKKKTVKNKIIIWSSSFFPVFGGLQSASFEIADYLAKNGWNVEVITNRYPRLLRKFEKVNDFQITRFSFFHNPLQYICTGRIDLLFTWIFYKPYTMIRLIIYFIRFKPDVVNLHFLDHQLFECYVLKYLFRYKLIISLHGNEVERMGKLKSLSLRYYLYNNLFKSASYITGCSKYLIDEFRKIFVNIEAKKCFPLYNGVSEIILTQDLTFNKKDYIFAATRFEPKKGLNLLVNAYQPEHDIELLIAGGYEDDLNQLNLQTKKGISFLGELSSSEMAIFLSDSRITVIPSIIEPYGILVAEALCCGSPIIASNVGGIPEVIALAKKKLNPIEEVVFDTWVKLVDPEVEAIGFAIESFLKNYSGLAEYINLIPKLRKQFSWSKRLNKYYSILVGF